MGIAEPSSSEDLRPKQRFHIAATVRYMKNHHVLACDAVDDDVFADRETPQARMQILVAAAADVGWRASRKKWSVMESLRRSATSTLPLSVAM